MTTKCEFCGQEFASRRRDARFCSSTCRSRAHRQASNGSGAGAQLKVLPPAPAATAATAGPGPVEQAAIAELTKMRRLHSASARSVLVLAERLDSSANETGSQLASLQRQFAAALQAAMAESADEPDFIDELKARIEAKRRAAREEPA